MGLRAATNQREPKLSSTTFVPSRGAPMSFACSITSHGSLSSGTTRLSLPNWVACAGLSLGLDVSLGPSKQVTASSLDETDALEKARGEVALSPAVN